MNLTASEIIERLAETRQGEQMIMGRLDQHTQRVVCVEYYFETYSLSFTPPLDSYLTGLRNKRYQPRPFPYEDIDGAIAAWRGFCVEQGGVADPEMEAYLRRDIPKGRECSLIIIPVVVTNK